jgi:hypothetical protein
VTDRQDPATAPGGATLGEPATTAADADDLYEYWPGDTSPAAVKALRQEFPGFRIWRELMVGQVQYLACRLQPGTHPHTVISPDPGKLRDALKAGKCHDPDR